MVYENNNAKINFYYLKNKKKFIYFFIFQKLIKILYINNKINIKFYIKKIKNSFFLMKQIFDALYSKKDKTIRSITSNNDCLDKNFRSHFK